MFNSHGEHTVRFDDGILTVEARGPFNNEQITLYHSQLHSILKRIKTPWAQLNILHQDCLFTPEGEKNMSENIKMRKDFGLSAIAVVFVVEGANSIVEQQLGRMYAQYDIPYACFDNTEEATLWLRKFLVE